MFAVFYPTHSTKTHTQNEAAQINRKTFYTCHLPVYAVCWNSMSPSCWLFKRYMSIRYLWVVVLSLTLNFNFAKSGLLFHKAHNCICRVKNSKKL